MSCFFGKFLDWSLQKQRKQEKFYANMTHRVNPILLEFIVL